MTDQVEIVRAAKGLVESYGDAAGSHAVMRIDELTNSGDYTALDLWRRILQAIEDLLQEGVPPGVSVH